MRGQNFQSGYCVVTQLAQTFEEFSYLYVDTSFCSIDHKLSTFETNLWKITQSEKLQIYITPGEITKHLLSTCLLSALSITDSHTLPILNWCGLFNPIDHCTDWVRSIQQGLFNCGVHGNIFSHLQLLISHKSASNVINIHFLEENEVSKCRWENSRNICVNYVTLEKPDLKSGLLIQVQTYFFEVLAMYKSRIISLSIDHMNSFIELFSTWNLTSCVLISIGPLANDKVVDFFPMMHWENWGNCCMAAHVLWFAWIRKC